MDEDRADRALLEQQIRLIMQHPENAVSTANRHAQDEHGRCRFCSSTMDCQLGPIAAVAVKRLEAAGQLP